MRERILSGEEDRLLLGSLVKNKAVCARISSQWDGELFGSEEANLIASWCVDFFNRYNESPNGQLELIFKDWAEKRNPPKELVKALADLLEGLKDVDGAATDYVLDLAGKYFNKVRIERELREASFLLENGDIDEAYSRLINLKKVELGAGSTLKLTEDYDVWRRAFEDDRREPLVIYPGILEEFLSKWFVRDSLYSFMGPDKSGKSMWLLDLAYRAVKARRRVAYFELGDLGEQGVIERLAVRCTGIPLDFPEGGRIRWPVGFEPVEGGVDVLTVEKEVKRVLSPGLAFKTFRKLTRGMDLFRLSCHSNSTLSLSGLRGFLCNWARDGWLPDVVVIDYADILALPGGKDVLDQIDVVWKGLRQVSQDFHCLVVTATQSNASAYRIGSRELLGKKHFSGRKTKLAHVSGMIGINVSSDDKENCVTRLNWVVRRSGRFQESRYVVVAGCWDVMNPAVISEWG